MTQLRLRGVTKAQIIVSVIAVLPVVYAGYQVVARGVAPQQLGLVLPAAAMLAFLPWISRAIARWGYRPRADEKFLFVSGEAVPWSAITRVDVVHRWRRTVAYISRGETVTVALLLDDAFAGRLEPRPLLDEKLRLRN